MIYCCYSLHMFDVKIKQNQIHLNQIQYTPITESESIIIWQGYMQLWNWKKKWNNSLIDVSYR